MSQTSEESDAPESVRDIVVTGSVSALAVVLFVAGYVLNKRWKNRKHLRRRK